MSEVLHPQSTPVPDAASPFLEGIGDKETYRNYVATSRACVKELYRLNHINQTLDFVLSKKAEYGRLDKDEMGIWEAMTYLTNIIDDSDPDIDLTQIDHALQTAEAIRLDGHPRWFILTGLIHDLGKILCKFGEPQWAVVGDTFPVGCSFSDEIVFSELFADNPDSLNPACQTATGIYEPKCGLDNIHLSWGHDEYLYLVTRNYLPEEAQWMIRYHSCYPIHREGAYMHLLNEKDDEILKWVRAFNPYDLYSKCDIRPDFNQLKPYYEDLVSEFFPDKIRW